MSRSAPKISVCVPAYNAAPYLSRTLASVLAQEFDDFELVVSDDSSTDTTPEICAGYADPRLRVVRSDQRLGQSGNWNRCLELACGEYVILLHADDELRSAYLPAATAVLDANPDVGLVHCAVEHIDENDRPLTLQRLFQQDVVDRDGMTLRHLLVDGCVINPSGVMVRREVYDRVGPFTDQVVWGVDWHMWIRIALRAPLAYLAEPLARYRQHGQSGTTSVMATGRNARDERWVLEDLFAQVHRLRPELDDLKSAALRGAAHRTWCFAEVMCRDGDMAAARAGLRNAARIWPGVLRQTKFWGLWAATYTGYHWFAQAIAQKQQLVGRLRGEGSAPR